MLSRILICPKTVEKHLLHNHSLDGYNYDTQNIHIFPNAIKLQPVYESNFDLQNRDNKENRDSADKNLNTFNSYNFKFKKIQEAAASSLS